MSSKLRFEGFEVAGSGVNFIGIAGENLANRQVVRAAADGLLYLADASVAATLPAIGITLAAASTGQHVLVLLKGFVGLSSWTWVAGELYVSDTAGGISQTAGTVRQGVGVAYSGTQIWFDAHAPQAFSGFMLGGGDDSNLGAGSTVYYYPYGSDDQANILLAQIRVPFDCVISELRANIFASAGAGESYTFTLMVEGAASTLTCQIAGAADTEANDLVNQVEVNEDDFISVRVVSSGAAAARAPQWSMKCVPVGI